MTIPLVYIAGPYRNEKEYEFFNNILAAREVAMQVWRCGAAAICPHLNTMFMGGSRPDSEFLAGDREIIRRCDAVYMMPEVWETSEGAKAERVFALSIGKPVFHSRFQLIKWIDKFQGANRQ